MDTYLSNKNDNYLFYYHATYENNMECVSCINVYKMCINVYKIINKEKENDSVSGEGLK